jgi:hypothetical protein
MWPALYILRTTDLEQKLIAFPLSCTQLKSFGNVCSLNTQLSFIFLFVYFICRTSTPQSYKPVRTALKKQKNLNGHHIIWSFFCKTDESLSLICHWNLTGSERRNKIFILFQSVVIFFSFYFTSNHALLFKVLLPRNSEKVLAWYFILALLTSFPSSFGCVFSDQWILRAVASQLVSRCYFRSFC